jgi:sigma-B regulation protein RsbU (phosphoserine phosphatase)
VLDNSTVFQGGGDLALIAGLMRQFAETGDAVAALRWALPRVLEEINAEAGSLFIYREEDDSLECVVCVGPVDVTGLTVSADEGLVGRSFTTGQSELVSDAGADKAHFHGSDDLSGFKTVSTATAPVHFADQHFGSIQAINRRSVDGRAQIENFTETDLALLSSLASTLAMAISNVRLAEQAINDQLLERDLDQAIEAQASLMPLIDDNGFASGKVIPARHLSGDFFDHFHVDGKVAFCQGDVAGKGISASLLMARCIALFRSFAKQGKSGVEIAVAINHELLDVASDKFVTFVSGWFDPKTGQAVLINCGHGPLLCMPESNHGHDVIDSHTVPLGLMDIPMESLKPWVGQLDDAALYAMTDGITESMSGEDELGFKGLVKLARAHTGRTSSARVADIMRRFREGELSTHDDATLLIITSVGQVAR